MDYPDEYRIAIRTVPALRISTSDSATSPGEESVDVILETPLYLDVEGVEQYTILCTPIDKLPMAVGFLFSEGVIDTIDDLSQLQECREDPYLIRIKLKNGASRIIDAGRNLMIVSSCGACGTEEFKKKLDAFPKVGDTLRLESKVLRSATNDITQLQPLFKTCGGAHIACLLNREGKILASAEDTGRHNALDKAIGKRLLNRATSTGCWTVLSGRVSLEMVGKCARAGIELISAISAPTSLAVEAAERLGITLCAFVRETRATLFTHPQRIVLPE